MDNVKMGKFICKLRKEKKMTQKELAEQIHVTDKAISKWETGKGFPDIKLLETLADILDVSVWELMSGERSVEAQITNEKANQIITDTLQKTDFYWEKAKKRKQILILTAIIGIAFVFIVGICARTLYVQNQVINLMGKVDGPTSIFYAGRISPWSDNPLLWCLILGCVILFCALGLLRINVKHIPIYISKRNIVRGIIGVCIMLTIGGMVGYVEISAELGNRTMGDLESQADIIVSGICLPYDEGANPVMSEPTADGFIIHSEAEFQIQQIYKDCTDLSVKEQDTISVSENMQMKYYQYSEDTGYFKGYLRMKDEEQYILFLEYSNHILTPEKHGKIPVDEEELIIQSDVNENWTDRLEQKIQEKIAEDVRSKYIEAEAVQGK
ncbi:MAG: helix-turn-helix transcriptional regulator [Hespellia sp.]|nr:helix-turn-helix transcriptional regulator [Hespellia sp.]